jgi:CreA protein
MQESRKLLMELNLTMLKNIFNYLLIHKFDVMLVLACLLFPLTGYAEEIGSVDTKFNLLSPDDSIKVEVFEDPKIDGVVCYLSKAQKGGYKGAVGIAEDTSDASLDCRQVGPIKILESLKKGESVFKERRSLIFKKLKVIRFCDSKRNAIIYLVYSERVIEGSPKNSVSAVPITRWETQSTQDTLAACGYE